MQDSDSWEAVVSSVINQLKNIEVTLENQNSSVEEYLQQNGNKAESQLLEAQLRSTQVSFKRMEDKLHDMIIYLCRAMSVSKMHNLQNLLAEDSYGMEQ
jgi:hypothetical protein